MKKKQCSSPRCGKIFIESDLAFASDSCSTCGIDLVEMVLSSSPISVLKLPSAANSRPQKSHISKPDEPFGDAQPRGHKPTTKSKPDPITSEPQPKRTPKLTEKHPERPAPIASETPTVFGARFVVFDRHGKERLVFPLLYDQVSVGRRSTRNLPPDLDLADVDDTHAVGREHLTVFRLSGEWHVRALGGRSATFVNESILLAGQTQELKHGDQIVLGDDQGVGLLFENP